MTKDEFKEDILRLTNYYDGKKKPEDRFYTKSILVEIYNAYQRFSRERLNQIIEMAFKECQYPPKLAELMQCHNKVRNAESSAYTEELPLLAFDPVFPTDDWIQDQIDEQKKENPALDEEFVLNLIKRIRNVMRVRHEATVNRDRSRGQRSDSCSGS